MSANGTEAAAAETRPDWLTSEEFPFRSRFVDVEGSRLHYVDEGEGPTLLLVHGGPAWSFVWRDVVLALRPWFRCVAPDLPGTGLSGGARGREGATLPVAAEALAGFIEALDVEDAVLVVHDVGGPVALAAAGRAPERWTGLVVSGSFAWPLDRENPDVARMLRIVGGRAFRLVNRWTNMLPRMMSTSGGVGRRLSREGRRAFRGPFRERARRDHALRLLGDVVQRAGFLARVEGVVSSRFAELPALLVYGEEDPGRKAGFQERFASMLPRSRSLVVPGAHHFPQSDAPHTFASAIRVWHDDEVRERVRGDA